NGDADKENRCRGTGQCVHHHHLAHHSGVPGFRGSWVLGFEPQNQNLRTPEPRNLRTDLNLPYDLPIPAAALAAPSWLPLRISFISVTVACNTPTLRRSASNRLSR